MQKRDIEAPEVVRLRATGVLRQDRARDRCFFCGGEVYAEEFAWRLDSLTVCGRYDCRYQAFSQNADSMLVQFALDLQVSGEAMDWFFENYAVHPAGPLF